MRFLCKFGIRAHKTIGKLIQMHINWTRSYPYPPARCLFNACHEVLKWKPHWISLYASKNYYPCMKHDPKRHNYNTTRNNKIVISFRIIFSNFTKLFTTHKISTHQLLEKQIRTVNLNVFGFPIRVCCCCWFSHFNRNWLFKWCWCCAAKRDNSHNSLISRLHHLVWLNLSFRSLTKIQCFCLYRKCW